MSERRKAAVNLIVLLGVIVVAGMAVMALVASPLLWLIHAEEKADRDWQEFSAVHHCHITQRPQSWHEVQMNTWTCDGGFEVLK